MKLVPSDPDVETIISRMTKGELDLQPDFQRGEVWSERKKQRLIDTVLREWHIPPIHLIDMPGGREQVLDGQQRLVAIRDFVTGDVRIDGSIPPHDSRILELSGKSYEELPAD